MFFHQYQKNYKGKVIAAGFIGALAGLLAGMLIAPKSGKETRKALKSWSDQMTDDIRERSQHMHDLTQEKYNQIVDAVSHKYRNMQNIKDSEIDDLTADLKKRWERIKDEWKK